MEKNSERLLSLDGLRGLAMLLVFFNHLTPKYLISAFPFLDRIGLFSSGITGVSFFFILSGFLMTYLYPHPHDKIAFLQKRYTRIFPLFLTMSVIMLLLSVYPDLPWYIEILGILGFAGIVHIIWVYGVKKISFIYFSKVLFLIFLAIQISVGCFYTFYIMKQPPIVFQNFSPILHTFTIGLVNSTLTFPLGNYIPMLDGVYWSLAAEILFYIIYPFLVVPLVGLLATQVRLVKMLFLLALLPFFAGVDILSHHILGLSALQFSLFYYFAFGILLGFVYRNKPHTFSIFTNLFQGLLSYIPIVLLFTLIIGIHLLNTFLPSSFSSWERLFSAFFFALIVAILLNKQTSLYKLLSKKFFVFIGTISYSLYLSHSAIIHLLENVHRATSLTEDIIMTIIALISGISLASILYFLLEKPYFQRKKIVSTKEIAKKSYILNFSWAKGILIGTTFVYLIAIFFSFQSKFNLFSLVTPYSSNVFTSPIASGSISMATYPKVTTKILANENNLGIILLSVKHIQTGAQTVNTPRFWFTLQEEGTKQPMVSLPYVLDEFRGEDFPFGFPVISNSKNKTYIATFTLVPPSKIEYATIDTKSIKAVYQLNKTVVFKQPSTTLHLFVSKFQNVVTNTLSLVTVILLLPFGGLSLFLLVKKIPSV